MLHGFSIETKRLTEVEQKLLPHIAFGLSKMIGSANAITNKEIIDKVEKKRGVKLNEARVRKIINHIRINNIVPGLVANGCGYYVTKDIMELKQYEKSLAGRIQAIEGVRKQVHSLINQLQSKQQSSFF